jgi:hypothetical protein
MYFPSLHCIREISFVNTGTIANVYAGFMSFAPNCLFLLTQNSFGGFALVAHKKPRLLAEVLKLKR